MMFRALGHQDLFSSTEDGIEELFKCSRLFNPFVVFEGTAEDLDNLFEILILVHSICFRQHQ